MTTISLPNTVNNIEGDAFSYCSALNDIILPSSLILIKSNAFYNSGLEKVEIPNSVTEIDYAAFQNCKKMKAIIISNSVKTIQSSAFSGCDKQCVVYSYIEKPFEIENVFSVDMLGNDPIKTLYVPKGTKEAYQNTSGWDGFSEYIEMEGTEPTGDSEEILLQNGLQVFCSQNALDFSSAGGPQAYIASGFNAATGEVLLTRVAEVPANTGVILRGSAGQTYKVPVKETAFVYSNLFVGVTEDTDITSGYVLNNSHFKVVYGSETVKGGEAYLNINADGKKQLKIRFTDTLIGVDYVEVVPTGVDYVEVVSGNLAGWHTLQGIRLDHKPTQRGIYLHGGRKVLVK